jgi:hypothetical protein
MKRLFVALVFLVIASLPSRSAEIYSFTEISAGVSCTGGDYSLNMAQRNVGAGIFPTEPSTIVGWDIFSFLPDVNDYVMVGHTQPNGDAITRYIYGPHSDGDSPYAAVNGFGFNPGEMVSGVNAASSGATLLTFAQLPSWVTAGMDVIDQTTPGAINPNTTVQSISGNTVILSPAISGSVSDTDEIEFQDQLHVHYLCSRAEGSGTFGVTIFYATP